MEFLQIGFFLLQFNCFYFEYDFFCLINLIKWENILCLILCQLRSLVQVWCIQMLTSTIDWFIWLLLLAIFSIKQRRNFKSLRPQRRWFIVNSAPVIVSPNVFNTRISNSMSPLPIVFIRNPYGYRCWKIIRAKSLKWRWDCATVQRSME